MVKFPPQSKLLWFPILGGLYEAKQEAQRFLKRVKEFEQEYPKKGDDYLWGNKRTGAIKRASMDLTRALADLRKSN